MKKSFGNVLLSLLLGTGTLASLEISALSRDKAKVQDRDLTFFVTSDTHIGRPDRDSLQTSRRMIRAMHEVPGKKFPAELGAANIDKPRGVVITGDLTDDNRLEQWKMFDDLWEVNGAGEIRYPVFEGWGNHDFHSGRNDVRAAMLERHTRRKYPVHVADGEGAHYSWDWQDVHFVHLNLYPGMDGGLSKYSPKNNNPRQSLAFLKEDLDREVGESQRPIVLFFHYGFDANGGTAWVEGEKREFYDVVEPYNVIALFVGHSHAQRFDQIITAPSSGKPRKLDVYMSDDALSSGMSKKTGFYVVSIRGKEMLVAERLIPGPQAEPNKDWGFIRKTILSNPPH